MLVCGLSPGVDDIISSLLFNSLDFCKVLRPMLVNGTSQQGESLNQCCGVWLPMCGAWILLHGRMVRLTSFSCFFFFFLLTTSKNENLALTVYVSICIPASLQVIACFGSLWRDRLSFFHFLWTWEVYLVCHRRIILGNSK